MTRAVRRRWSWIGAGGLSAFTVLMVVVWIYSWHYVPIATWGGYQIGVMGWAGRNHVFGSSFGAKDAGLSLRLIDCASKDYMEPAIRANANLRVQLMTNEWAQSIPIWPAVMAAFVANVFWCIRLAHSRPRAGFCPQCDYDLTGNTTGQCPECGAAIGAKSA